MVILLFISHVSFRIISLEKQKRFCFIFINNYLVIFTQPIKDYFWTNRKITGNSYDYLDVQIRDIIIYKKKKLQIWKFIVSHTRYFTETRFCWYRTGFTNMLKNIFRRNTNKKSSFFRFFYIFFAKYLHITNISPTFVIVKDGSCETSLL